MQKRDLVSSTGAAAKKAKSATDGDNNGPMGDLGSKVYSAAVLYFHSLIGWFIVCLTDCFFLFFQTLAELKELCKANQLPVSGTKAVLIERLSGIA